MALRAMKSPNTEFRRDLLYDGVLIEEFLQKPRSVFLFKNLCALCDLLWLIQTEQQRAAFRVVRGNGRFEAQRLAGERMSDLDARGVEHLARGIEAVERSAAAVECVAPDGMSQMREMDTDLVGASGVEQTFDLGAVPALLKDAVIGPRRAPPFRVLR